MISNDTAVWLGAPSPRRIRRVIPAWCVSLGVHGLLCACLFFGVDRLGIPDGSGADQRARPLSARFTSIDTRDESSAESSVEFVTNDETPPQQPDPAEMAESGESPPDESDLNAVAVATVSRPADIVPDEGPAIPVPQPETIEAVPDNAPRSRRPRGAASLFASLLPASSRFSDAPARHDDLPGEADGNGAGQQFGQPNGTSFFQIRAQGAHFCYVVDCSSSMEEGNAIAIARGELNASLRRLDTSKQFQILFYDSELHPMIDRGRDVFFATDTNRTLARQFMSGQQPNNRAMHKPALLAAFRSNPDVIFLLTDGQLPELSARDLYDLKINNKRRIQINVIEFGKGAKLGTNWLDQLAQDHRGMYRYEDITERRN